LCSEGRTNPLDILRAIVPTHPADVVPPLGLVQLCRSGALDPELAALLWLLREGGLPALVIGPVGEESVPVVAEALEAIEAIGAPAPADGTAATAPVRTLRAASLQEAFDVLAADPFHLTDDAIRSLGLVVVVQDGRVVAAHYLRPVERDREGHLQRRPPAVLATWEESTHRFEHFAWAVTPELAVRVNRTQAELEEQTSERARQLAATA
jgi:hypothetical protein